MYKREDIEKLVPNSKEPLELLYEKYQDIVWLEYLYLDNDYEDYYIAISTKGDIIYNTYYVGILLPDTASLKERRFDYGLEMEEGDIYIHSRGQAKNIQSIVNMVDNILYKKMKNDK